MTELKDLLDRAGDDDGRPVLTDLEDLLARAEHGRTRSRVRRVAGTVVAAGAAAGLVVAAAAAQSGGTDVGPPVSGTPTSTATHHTAPTLTTAEVIARCRPQLDAYSTLPMYTSHPDRADWFVASGHYLVGDLVIVDPGDGYNPEFCRIPAAGHADDPVPLSSYTGSASDRGDLTQNCRQIAGSTFSGDSFALDDADGGDITAADTVDGVSAAVLVTPHGEAALCSMSPVTWDAGITDLQRFDQGIALAYGTTGGANKSIVGQTASWYLLGGVVSPQAARVELSVEGGPTATFAVHDGYVAGVLRDAGPGGLVPVDWRVLDDQGNELSTGHEQ